MFKENNFQQEEKTFKNKIFFNDIQKKFYK